MKLIIITTTIAVVTTHASPLRRLPLPPQHLARLPLRPARLPRQTPSAPLSSPPTHGMTARSTTTRAFPRVSQFTTAPGKGKGRGVGIGDEGIGRSKSSVHSHNSSEPSWLALDTGSSHMRSPHPAHHPPNPQHSSPPRPAPLNVSLPYSRRDAARTIQHPRTTRNLFSQNCTRCTRLQLRSCTRRAQAPRRARTWFVPRVISVLGVAMKPIM